MLKYIVLLSHIVTTYLLTQVPRQKKEALNQEKMVHVDPALFSTLSFGHNRLLSSIQWIMIMIQSDIDRSQKEGERSWMYYRFLQIARLDPYFYNNYGDGGLYLSVIKDDVVGAKNLYEKGLKIYKNDFKLNYYGAFNDFFELNDRESALKKYRILLDSPEIEQYPYLYTMIAKVESMSKGNDFAWQMLTSILPTTKNKLVRKRIIESLYAIKAQRDLECLQKKESHLCSHLDFHGKPYIKDRKGRFHASEPWKPFKIYKKK